MATPEENKAVYRRFLQQAFNEGKIDQLDQLLTPDYVLHDAPPGTPEGPESVRQVVTMFRAAFPDLEIEIHEQVAEGDLVASRTTMRGTHRGDIFGVRASGNTVAVPGLTMVRVRDGRVAESWVRNDTATLMAQIAPQAAGARA